MPTHEGERKRQRESSNIIKHMVDKTTQREMPQHPSKILIREDINSLRFPSRSGCDDEHVEITLCPPSTVSTNMRMMRRSRQEISLLSAKERNRILESMHGVLVDSDDDHADMYQHYLAKSTRRNKEEMLSRRRAFSVDYQTDLLGKTIRTEEHPSQVVMSTEEDDEEVSLKVGSEKNFLLEGGIKADSQHEFQRKASCHHATIGVGEKSHLQWQKDLAFHCRAGFIQQKLDELDRAIDQIQLKGAYNVALEDSDKYVEDPKFRLVFLRADYYDVKKAASRLVSFMEEKLKRFGQCALTRQLTIDDLSWSAKSLLIKKGVTQLLPARDSAGRAILVIYYQISLFQEEIRNDPKSLGDVLFFSLSAMVEDQETQRRGIVTILLIKCTSEEEKEEVNKFFHSSLKDLATRVYSWCPLKCHAHHHWIHDDNNATGHIEFMQSFDTSASKRKQSKENDDDSGASALSSSLFKSGLAILDSIMLYFGKEYRIRTRLHEGSFEEFQANLKTFGIPADHLPFSMDGSEVRVSGSHTKWVQKRRQKEAALILRPQATRKQENPEQTFTGSVCSKRKRDATITTLSSCFDAIDIPGRHDVCLGRGSALHQHSGNIAMRAMMEPLVADYGNATSTRRQYVNKLVIQAVHMLGGRFLSNETTDGGWFEVVVDEAIVEKRIGGIFRSMVSRRNARNHQSAEK